MNRFREVVHDVYESSPEVPNIIVGILILIIAATGFGLMMTYFGNEPQISVGVFVTILITSVVSRNWQAKSAIMLTVLMSLLCMIFAGEAKPERFLAGWFLLTFIGLDGSFLIRRLFSFF